MQASPLPMHHPPTSGPNAPHNRWRRWLRWSLGVSLLLVVALVMTLGSSQADPGFNRSLEGPTRTTTMPAATMISNQRYEEGDTAGAGAVASPSRAQAPLQPSSPPFDPTMPADPGMVPGRSLTWQPAARHEDGSKKHGAEAVVEEVAALPKGHDGENPSLHAFHEQNLPQPQQPKGDAYLGSVDDVGPAAVETVNPVALARPGSSARLEFGQRAKVTPKPWPSVRPIVEERQYASLAMYDPWLLICIRAREPGSHNLVPLIDALVAQIPEEEGNFLADKVQIVVVNTVSENAAYNQAKYLRSKPGSKNDNGLAVDMISCMKVGAMYRAKYFLWVEENTRPCSLTLERLVDMLARANILQLYWSVLRASVGTQAMLYKLKNVIPFVNYMRDNARTLTAAMMHRKYFETNEGYLVSKWNLFYDADMSSRIALPMCDKMLFNVDSLSVDEWFKPMYCEHDIIWPCGYRDNNLSFKQLKGGSQRLAPIVYDHNFDPDAGRHHGFAGVHDLSDFFNHLSGNAFGSRDVHPEETPDGPELTAYAQRQAEARRTASGSDRINKPVGGGGGGVDQAIVTAVPHKRAKRLLQRIMEKKRNGQSLNKEESDFMARGGGGGSGSHRASLRFI